MAETRHPGITMHKLSVGSGFVGLLFTLGCSLIFVLGFPALWYFVAFSAGFGVAVAGILSMLSDRRTERQKPLSIFPATEETQSQTGQQPASRQNLLQAPPRYCAT